MLTAIKNQSLILFKGLAYIIAMTLTGLIMLGYLCLILWVVAGLAWGLLDGPIWVKVLIVLGFAYFAGIRLKNA